MSADLPVVTLTAADIPGAHLCEPYDKHTVAALRWWLLCRGIKIQCIYMYSCIIHARDRNEKMSDLESEVPELSSLVEELHDVKVKWFSIGLQLKIRPATLKALTSWKKSKLIEKLVP